MVPRVGPGPFFPTHRLLPAVLALGLVSCSSSPTSPLEVAQLSLGAAYDVFVDGPTAYVSNNQGIAILDIGDIRYPRRIGLVQAESTQNVLRFHVSGDTLYTYGDRFSMFALGGGGDPQHLASYEGRGFLGGVQRRGDLLFLAYLHGGLEILEIDDISKPSVLGFIESNGRVDGLALVGDYAYLAIPSRGLEVFQVEDPTAPVHVGTVPGTSGAADIHLHSGLLHLGCYIHGVKILDLTNPGSPSVIGSFNNGGETWGVFAHGSRLYTVDLAEGVEVLDIDSPTHPRLIMTETGYHPHDLFTDGRYLFLADQDEHFVVLPLDLQEVSG